MRVAGSRLFLGFRSAARTVFACDARRAFECAALSAGPRRPYTTTSARARRLCSNGDNLGSRKRSSRSATILLAWALASVGPTPVHAASASARIIRSRGFVRVPRRVVSTVIARFAREEASLGGNRPPATPRAVTIGGGKLLGGGGVRDGSVGASGPPRPALGARAPHDPPPPPPPRRPRLPRRQEPPT